MSDIQRYSLERKSTPIALYNAHVPSEPDELCLMPDGEWCEYSDVEPLEERITKLEEFIDELARDNDLSPLSDWRDGF